ncbi:MAG: hypothetical protein IPN21_02340 [Burkholderiales bacterium]|nr:hypothetical protein [Burkholderiales bacterium]
MTNDFAALNDVGFAFRDGAIDASAAVMRPLAASSMAEARGVRQGAVIGA